MILQAMLLSRIITEIGEADLEVAPPEDADSDPESLKTASEEAPVVKYVNSLLLDAIRKEPAIFIWSLTKKASASATGLMVCFMK